MFRAKHIYLPTSVTYLPQLQMSTRHNVTMCLCRNNLTIMEGVLLTGRGAFPHFELGGRRPGSDVPLQFDVSLVACGPRGLLVVACGAQIDTQSM